jgi:hypothetical protein
VNAKEISIIPNSTYHGVEVHTCNLNIQEADAVGSPVQGHLGWLVKVSQTKTHLLIKLRSLYQAFNWKRLKESYQV